MEMAELTKVYLEVGVLGLIAIVFVLIAILLIKKLLKSSDKHEDYVSSISSSLIQTITAQNNALIQTINNNNVESLNKAVKEITNHTLSAEENAKQTRIDDNIRTCLHKILKETDADRVSIVQYHNGGRGLNKQSFLKMSMTCEDTKSGILPIISTFQNQFRSVLAYFVKELNETGKCYIKNSEDMKQIDSGMYEFLVSRDVKSKYGMAIRNKEEDLIIGFICVEYVNKPYEDVDHINEVLIENHNTIEMLLTM